MSSWKTVIFKKNKKKRKNKTQIDDDCDNILQPSSFNVGILYSNSYFVQEEVRTELLSEMKHPKVPIIVKDPSSVEINDFNRMNGSKEVKKDKMVSNRTYEKEKALKKAINAKSKERDNAIKRKEAQNLARKLNDPIEWPKLKDILIENGEDIMDHFDNALNTDTMLIKGGLGSFLITAPSILENHLLHTNVPESVLIESKLLSVHVDEEEDAKAIGHYFRSLITQMPELSSKEPKDEALVNQALLFLISLSYGSKGMKEILCNNNGSGRGVTLAIEWTFQELCHFASNQVVEIVKCFIDPSSGIAYSQISRNNCLRILMSIFRGLLLQIDSKKSILSESEKNEIYVKISRCVLLLLSSGLLAGLFDIPTKLITTAKKVSTLQFKGYRNNFERSLIEIFANAFKIVGANPNLISKTCTHISFKECSVYVEAIIKSGVDIKNIQDPWSTIAIELAKYSSSFAKFCVPPILEKLQEEISGTVEFCPVESTLAVLFSICLINHPKAVIPYWRGLALKYQLSSIVLLEALKKNKIDKCIPQKMVEEIESLKKFNYTIKLASCHEGKIKEVIESYNMPRETEPKDDTAIPAPSDSFKKLYFINLAKLFFVISVTFYPFLLYYKKSH